MVGDDDLEPARASLGDLLDGGDPAVDGEDEPAALVGESREGLALHAVALLEAARKVPLHVCAELAEHEDGERRRADAVGVVVTVHADPLAGRDRRPDRLAGTAHVAEQEWVVPGQLAGQERSCTFGTVVAATDQHARGRLAHVELARERHSVWLRTGFDRPDARFHGDRPNYGEARTAGVSLSGWRPT